MARGPGLRKSLVITLDIAGAFDRVWHRGLLTKLEQLGVVGELLELYSSYLQDRNLRVVVSGCTSAMYPIEASVPQESILSPILYNIYLNDLLQSLPLASAYGDHCTLSHSYTRDETANVIEDTNRHHRLGCKVAGEVCRLFSYHVRERMPGCQKVK